MNKLNLTKKIIICLMAIIMLLGLSSCGKAGSPEAVQPEEQIEYEVALITDDSLIMDGGHSEMAWNAIVNYCCEHGLSHKYYKATEATKAAYENVIQLAIKNGAKIVIADNDSMSDAVYSSEDKYSDVKFMILNANPGNNANGDIYIKNNTVDITFSFEQAGYLAGYAAVKDGYENVGFIGQSGDKEYTEYGYGFVIGADRAARENSEGMQVKMRYSYVNGSDDSAAYNTAASWFKNGTDVIMAAGKNIDREVIRAAESNGGKVICCQSDKSSLSDVVLTTAEVYTNKAIDDLLAKYSEDKFPGGNIINYDASNGGVGLALRVNGFRNLTQEDYDTIYDKLADGKIKLNIENLESVYDIRVKMTGFIK